MFTNFSKKLRFIYFPFVLVTLGFILVYTFLNWLLIIHLEWLTVKEQFVDFFGPIILCIPLVYFLLRPRVKLLQFKNDNGPNFIYFMVVFAMVVPTIIAQKYIAAATGKLSRLEHIYEVAQHPKTKYYQLGRYYLYGKGASFTRDIYVSGKHNQDLNFILYTVQPILKTPSDTVKKSCHYWLCNSYREIVSNRMNRDQKEKALDHFLEDKERVFRSTNFNNYSYLERIGTINDVEKYKKAVTYNFFESDGNDVYFQSRDGSFEHRTGNKLGWFFLTLSIGLAVLLLLLLCYSFTSVNPSTYLKNHSSKENLQDTFEIFIPKTDYYITPILININILVYIAMIASGLGFISFKAEDLLHWGAVHRYSVVHGEWWRLLTGVFLHGNIMHIANNLLSLFFISFFLEPLLGKWRYLLVYLLCGLCASVASICWYKNTVSVGASGAVFGLFGFMLALILMKVFEPELNKMFMIITSIFIGYNLLMGLAGGVDNAAHIGGLLSGLLIGTLLSSTLEEEIKERNKKL